MQTRLNLIDSAAVAIDRTAASAVPHRLLVFVAKNATALKNPAVIAAARTAASTELPAASTSYGIAAATTDKPAAGAFVRVAATSTVVEVPAVVAPAATPAAEEGAAAAATEEETPAVAADEAAVAATTTTTVETIAAGATATSVYKDSTLRNIFEALLESDPIALLESLANSSAVSSSSSDSVVVPSFENIVRYAYQVILPATIAAETKLPRNTNAKGGDQQRAAKMRRTEDGAATTEEKKEGSDDAAAAAETDDANADGPSSSLKLNAEGFTAALSECSRTPNHPAFFFTNAIEDFTIAEAAANALPAAQRNRAIIDALSILMAGSAAPHFHLPARDVKNARALLVKAGLLPAPTPKATTAATAGAAATEEKAEDDAAEKKADGEEEEKPAEEEATEEKKEEEGDAEKKEEGDDTAAAPTPAAAAAAIDNVAAIMETLTLEDCLKRVGGASAEKAAALFKLFAAAKDDAKAILRSVGNAVEISHVFPDTKREASSAVIGKFTIVPENIRGAGAAHHMSGRHAAPEDFITSALCTLICGRLVLLPGVVPAAVAPQHNNNRNNRGRNSNNSNANKTTALSELMNPQGFDFRFGDALMITAAK